MNNPICEFEQQPQHPRCDKPAEGLLTTKVMGSSPHKARYCRKHGGFVMHQLKGTYVRIVNWTLFKDKT